MNTGKNYHVYAWTTIVMWALSHIWIRVALTHFSVFSLGFLRYFCASVTLILLGCFVKIPLPEKKDAPWFFLCGATGFFLYMICYNIGAKTTTVATSGVILSTAPVFTVLLSIVFLKETKHRFLIILLNLIKCSQILILKGFEHFYCWKILHVSLYISS